MDAIKVILERTPPELAADIIKDGVYFTGGTSQINNLEKYIKDETNLNVNIVEHPAESVVRGLMGVVLNLPRLHILQQRKILIKGRF